MCVVSMVADHYQDKWTAPGYQQLLNPAPFTSPVSREEYEKEIAALKKEVQDMKELLIKAKAYDERNNEPNCEMEQKIAFLKKVGDVIGVDLSDIFPDKPKANEEKTTPA